MKRFVLSLVVLACIGMTLPGTLSAQTPIITHSAITKAPPGQPIRVVANVTIPNGTLKDVTLFCTPDVTQPKTQIEMRDAGAGVFVGNIPASMTAIGSEVNYYVEARSVTGDWQETPFYRFNIVNEPIVAPVPVGPGPGAGPSTIPTQKQTTSTYPTETRYPAETRYPSETVETEEERTAKKKKYAWIGGAAVAAVAVGAWLLGGSDDDDGGDSSAPTGNTTTGNTTTGNTTTGNTTTGNTTTPGTTSSGAVAAGTIVRGANDNVSTAVVRVPVDTIVNVAGELGNGTIESVKINFTWDPQDTSAESFQVLHGNQIVHSTGLTSTPGSIEIVSPGSSPVVTIRIGASERNSANIYNWAWSAAMTYNLSSVSTTITP